MALITLLDAQLAYGHVPLLDHADFSLIESERIGLIGRNGAGKSSLLKILAGLEKPDDGTLQIQQNVRVTYVAQEPVLDMEADVFTAASAGLGEVIAIRDQYLSGAPGLDLDALQSKIEAYDAWNWEQRVEETLHRLHLDGAARIGSLSGGTRKRVALAQALVAAPDVLLLDEPTNHLDLATKEMLIGALQDYEGAMLFVSHDRTFLRGLANRVLDVSACPQGGRPQIYPGGYSEWVEKTGMEAPGVHA
jgi:ATP-binding cassette subfamily F protein uup